MCGYVCVFLCVVMILQDVIATTNGGMCVGVCVFENLCDVMILRDVIATTNGGVCVGACVCVLVGC